MSTTLTWNYSGLGTKSGITMAAVIDDLVALINSKSADANYKWQVASSNNATSPLYIVLKRKDASAGRLLLTIFTSTPGAVNSTAFDAVPTTNALCGIWFPAGNVDTPSNITTASGTMMGNDTGVVKCWATIAMGTAYAADMQPFTFDNNEGIWFFFQNPAGASVYGAGAGKLIVDGADVEYEAVVSFGGNTINGLGSGAIMSWQGTTNNAGSAAACVRTNYGSANRTYYMPWSPNGQWANQAVGGSDILSDTTTQRMWFQAISLLGQNKGEGIVLKLRQFGYGPATTGPFTVYNTTGPVVAARQVNAATFGGAGYPWFTNFKI